MVLIVLAALTLQPAQAGEETLPAGCSRGKLANGVSSIDSPWFREGRGEQQWILVYPNPRREKQAKPDPGALLDPVDPDRILAAPEAEGKRLLAAIKSRLCRPWPEGLELEWSAFLQRDVGGMGPTWLTLSAHQSIDGLPVDRQYSCYINYGRQGELQNFRCKLQRPESVYLPTEEWPSDNEAADMAEQAYLADLRNLPGPGQRSQRIERYYSAVGPIIAVKHVGCGSTYIDVRSGEARYSCSPGDFPVRPLYGTVSQRETATVIQLQARGFGPEQVVAANRDGALLVRGSHSQAWTDEAGVEHAADQQLLLLVDKAGRKLWQRALGHHSVPTWLRVQGDHVLVLRQPNGRHIPGPVLWQWLSLATGEVLADEDFDFSLPSLLLPDNEGERLFLAREGSNESHDLVATDLSGKVLWKTPPSEAYVHGMTLGAGGGPVLLVSKNLGGDQHYAIASYSRDGEALWSTRVALPMANHLELLGVRNEQAYLLLYDSGEDTRGTTELRVFSIRDGSLLRQRFLPPVGGFRLLSDGGVLYLGRDGGWAVAGVDGGTQDWRRYFGFGGSGQAFVDAADMGDGTMVFVGSYSVPRETVHTPGRFALARVVVLQPGAASRAEDCPLVSEHALRELELRLWSEFHVYLRPELFDYEPDTACVDRHRGDYLQFLQELEVALSARNYRAPSYFVHLRLEPGQPGVRLRGGGVGRLPRWYQQRSYLLRAGFTDARPLAEFLSGGLLRHVRRVERWRQDFTSHTGFKVGVLVPWETDAEPSVASDTVLAEVERDLAKLVTAARSLPASQYPDFGGLGEPPPLDLKEGALFVPAGNRQDPEKRLAVATLEAEQLRNALSVVQQAQWQLRRKDCDNNTGVLANRDLYRAAYCNEPELITSALLQNTDPDSFVPPGTFYYQPLLHSAVYNPKLVEAMLSAGADQYARDNFGKTALHIAVEQNARASIAYLAEDRRLANMAAYDGVTPLHRAVFRPRYPVSVLEPLVRQAEDIDARNLDGETALHLAVHSPELVALLLSAGADANAYEERGQTPLHRAARTWLARDSIALLLEAGADTSAVDAEGRTPLALAREYRLPENAEALERGARP